MVDKYRTSELMWQKLAKLHLNGFVYNCDTEIIQKNQTTNNLNCIRLEYN